MPVHKLQRTATVFKKKNTYTLYVTREKPYRPVRYIMHGYDTLLYSFYDHYIVDYLSFREWEFDFNVMKIPKGTKEVKLLRINRDLTKLRRRRRRRRRRQRQRGLQKTIGLMSKRTTLHVHHAFLYISLQSLHNCDVKLPNFKFT